MAGRHVTHPVTLRRLEVLEVVDLGPRLRRVVLGGDELRPFHKDGRDLPAFVSDGPDDHVKLVLPGPDGVVRLPEQHDGHLHWPEDGSVVQRDYTVRRFDAEAGTVTVDFVRHGDGPAATWAEGVALGDVLHVAGPRASFRYGAAAHLVLVGDETALPAIGRFVEEAGPDVALTVVVATDGPDGRIELLRGDGTVQPVTWLDLSAGGSLLAAVRDLPPLGPDPFVFAAGETALVAPLRAHLRDERGLSAEQVRVTGYWRAGAAVEDEARSFARLTQLSDLLTPNALRVAATVRLFDHVRDGVSSVAHLAERLGADPVAVEALVEHLVSIDVLGRGQDDVPVLAPAGELLVDDHPSELRRRLDLDGAEAHIEQSWSSLLHTVRTGEPGYEAERGEGFWERLRRDPALAASFDGYLARWAYVWVPLVRDGYPWDRHHHIVDVGGGMGLLLAELLQAVPSATGTLLEQETPAASAAWWFDQQGVGDRGSAVVGDFFEAVPAGDAIVLAQVLHDWRDDDARRILARCAAALAPGGRVVIVERVRAETGPGGHAESTLRMLNLFGAEERRASAFVALAAEVGLGHVETRHLGGAVSIIELEATS